MACCGQSRPLRPVAPPKSYSTRGLNPQAGTAGSPGAVQHLTAQPAPEPVQAAPKKPARTPV